MIIFTRPHRGLGQIERKERHQEEEGRLHCSEEILSSGDEGRPLSGTVRYHHHQHRNDPHYHHSHLNFPHHYHRHCGGFRTQGVYGALHAREVGQELV